MAHVGNNGPNWQKRLNKLRERCHMDSERSDNFEKRVLYSEVELLKMEIEEMTVGDGLGGKVDTTCNSPRKDGEKDPLSVLREKSLDELQQLGDALKLGFVRRRKQWWDKLDEFARLIGVWICLVIFAVFFSPLGICLRPLDYILVSLRLVPPQLQLSLLMKRMMGYVLLWTAGVVLVTEGMAEGNDSFFKSNACVLCCFSHASTLDAFIIAAVIPVRSYILSKTDLFVIPFFSWLLAAFGGVPIDRNNRSHAVKSLKLAAESASAGDCVAVAPEGTRSTTGQLLSFKKGPFHLWEQLQSPVVPVVIFGAYDLFPPGSTMTLSGRVYVRFLDPVEPPVEIVVGGGLSGGNSGSSVREKMSRAVRREMLEALLHSPRDAGSELTWKDRALTSTILLGVYAFAYNLTTSTYEFITVQLQLSLLVAAFYGTLLSIFITLVVYVSMVCMLPYREHLLLLCGLCKETDTLQDSRHDGTMTITSDNPIQQSIKSSWNEMLFGRWSLRKKGYRSLSAAAAPLDYNSLAINTVSVAGTTEDSSSTGMAALAHSPNKPTGRKNSPRS